VAKSVHLPDKGTELNVMYSGHLATALIFRMFAAMHSTLGPADYKQIVDAQLDSWASTMKQVVNAEVKARIPGSGAIRDPDFKPEEYRAMHVRAISETAEWGKRYLVGLREQADKAMQEQEQQEREPEPQA
jgi:hypothetical protein